MDFAETDISKIYPNKYFGYNKITVERPLRLSVQFTAEAIETLRYDKSIQEEAMFTYAKLAHELEYPNKSIAAYQKFNDLFPKSAHANEAKKN